MKIMIKNLFQKLKTNANELRRFLKKKMKMKKMMKKDFLKIMTKKWREKKKIKWTINKCKKN